MWGEGGGVTCGPKCGRQFVWQLMLVIGEKCYWSFQLGLMQRTICLAVDTFH